MTDAIPIEAIDARAYVIPTDAPESDGTIAWDSTTLVVCEVRAGSHTGLGYSYADASAADLVRRVLAKVVRGRDSLAVTDCYVAMTQAVRNVGRPGIASTAISAVDLALWDLKARILGVPLVALLGAVRSRVPVYGSGGFTSYTVERLVTQLAAWAERGITAVKMKVGRDAAADGERVRAARGAIGDRTALFVDANGAYDVKVALAQGEAFAAQGVSWFEEPVSSDNLAGLRFLRERLPTGMEVAAGEYGYMPVTFRGLLEHGAVDVLQADATRCGGVSGFLIVSALCDAFDVPLSAHTAPSVHVHLGCASPRLRHLEYFHDHVRIEQLLFDGAPIPRDGLLAPDTSRPGLGFEFKRGDAERFAA